MCYVNFVGPKYLGYPVKIIAQIQSLARQLRGIMMVVGPELEGYHTIGRWFESRLKA